MVLLYRTNGLQVNYLGCWLIIQILDFRTYGPKNLYFKKSSPTQLGAL